MPKSVDLNETILAMIRQSPDGVDSYRIAVDFLKIKNPDPRMAHRAVSAILTKERCCYAGADNRWYYRAEAEPQAGESLRGVRWRAVHVLTGAGDRQRTVVHVSVWDPFGGPRQVCSTWLVDPAALSPDEQAILCGSSDTQFPATDGAEAGVAAVAKALEESVAIFLSGHQQGLLMRAFTEYDISFPDDTVMLAHLAHASGTPVSRSGGLDTVFAALFGSAPGQTSAAGHGQRLAQCVAELVERAGAHGVKTRSELETFELDQPVGIEWAAKSFSLETIRGMLPLPGVYGFKDERAAWLYIGKAANLRRRLLSYFRDTDESPKKLLHLRESSRNLEVYRCGSELECLLYEYRLIKKHKPTLNSQRDINERKGTFAPIEDCAIILPHAEPGKGLAIWFRRNQKIVIKPFAADGGDREAMCRELSEFFFEAALPAAPADFPEQEIVVRWVKKHRDDCMIVPVGRLAGPAEACDAILSAWRELGSHSAQSVGISPAQ
jgi:hypothetical protein